MADAKKTTTMDGAGKELPAPAPRARGGSIVLFYRQVRSEIAKVTWPSWKETWLTTVMVFIMVIITMVFFFAVDWIFAYGERLFVSMAG